MITDHYDILKHLGRAISTTTKRVGAIFNRIYTLENSICILLMEASHHC